MPEVSRRRLFGLLAGAAAAPLVKFPPPRYVIGIDAARLGSESMAIAKIARGRVYSITVMSGGAGYTNDPTIKIGGLNG